MGLSSGADMNGIMQWGLLLLFAVILLFFLSELQPIRFSWFTIAQEIT
jgi:hypothetical protein